MRYCFPLFLCIATLGPACAGFDACPPGQPVVDGRCTPPPDPCPASITKPILLGCVSDPVLSVGGRGEPYNFFTYELTVEPGPIISGEPFGAFFEGRALIGAPTLSSGLVTVARTFGVTFRRVELIDFQATVQIRQGAQGDDVVLKTSPIPHTCTYDDNGMTEPEAIPPFPACSPENDREDGSNDDCIGLDGIPHPDNPCLPYVELSTSDDCSVGGACDLVGQAGPGGPCELAGFCVTEAAEVRLERGDGAYIADPSGSVLFGWADEGFPTIEVGRNRGAYDPSELSRRSNEEVGPNGFRVNIAAIPLPFECVMGELSRGPDGVPTVDSLTSRSPDGVLISCPIQEPD